MDKQASGYKCDMCSGYHDGMALKWSFIVPDYWSKHVKDHPKGPRAITGDFCVIDNHHFTKGLLDIPILASAEVLSLGVWVSLSPKNFQAYITGETKLGAMERRYRCTLANRIPGYPSTLQLKGEIVSYSKEHKPQILLAAVSVHPLCLDYTNGIPMKQVHSLIHCYGRV